MADSLAAAAASTWPITAVSHSLHRQPHHPRGDFQQHRRQCQRRQRPPTTTAPKPSRPRTLRHGGRSHVEHQPCRRSALAFRSPQAPAETMTIANVTTDADLGALTNLDISSAKLSGSGEVDVFALGNRLRRILTKSQSANLQVSFAPHFRHFRHRPGDADAGH